MNTRKFFVIHNGFQKKKKKVKKEMAYIVSYTSLLFYDSIMLKIQRDTVRQ